MYFLSVLFCQQTVITPPKAPGIMRSYKISDSLQSSWTSVTQSHFLPFLASWFSKLCYLLSHSRTIAIWLAFGHFFKIHISLTAKCHFALRFDQYNKHWSILFVSVILIKTKTFQNMDIISWQTNIDFIHIPRPPPRIVAILHIFPLKCKFQCLLKVQNPGQHPQGATFLLWKFHSWKLTGFS